jgi:hypothetical protein
MFITLRLLFILLLFPTFSFSYDLPIVYLTWSHNPESSIVIHWITDSSNEADEISFKRKDQLDEWVKVEGSHRTLPDGVPNYFLHSIELNNLSPDTEYTFRLKDSNREYSFETMPLDLKRPVRFVIGGDLYHDTLEPLIHMNKIAASKNPQFALLGGDIAYSAFKNVQERELVVRWLDFLEVWDNTMVTSKGHKIPILAAIGNHDVKGYYNQTPEQAPFFYALFLLPGEKSYRAVDFGKYMSILLLDTDHTFPIEGSQSQWLEETLKNREKQKYKFAIYHVPAYPSVRSFDGKLSEALRKTWVPLFEKYGLTAAFENHDHAYKRTHFIKGNKINPFGVVYIGDGGWGVTQPRVPKTPAKRGFLVKSAAKRNFVLATVTADSVEFEAIDPSGKSFDKVKIGSLQGIE